MVFWVGILAGAVLAWVAVKIGFYEMWAVLVNLVLSAYLAVAFAPKLAETSAFSGNTHSSGLAFAAVAVGGFVVLHGLTYIVFLSQFKVPFGKLLDTAGAGILGFLGGILAWGLVVIAISLMQVKVMGLDTESAKGRLGYVSGWTNLVHSVVGSGESLGVKEAIAAMLDNVERKEQARLAARKFKAPVVAVETNAVEEDDILGSPPEPEVEDF